MAPLVSSAHAPGWGLTLISESTRNALLRHGLHEARRAIVVPDCVGDAFVWSPKPFAQDCPRVLQVGTAAHKNIERLAEALRGIPCRLAIVGRLSRSQRAALDVNAIAFDNRLSLDDAQILEEYRRADLVAFVSTFEGFGLPILEAQAVGRPVVAGRVHSMPEVAGEGACLVDPYNVSEIRAAVLRVVADAAYRESLIAAGQRNVRRFRSSEIAAGYARIYAGLAGSAPPRS